MLLAVVATEGFRSTRSTVPYVYLLVVPHTAPDLWWIFISLSLSSRVESTTVEIRINSTTNTFVIEIRAICGSFVSFPKSGAGGSR